MNTPQRVFYWIGITAASLLLVLVLGWIFTHCRCGGSVYAPAVVVPAPFAAYAPPSVTTVGDNEIIMLPRGSNYQLRVERGVGHESGTIESRAKRATPAKPCCHHGGRRSAPPSPSDEDEEEGDAGERVQYEAPPAKAPATPETPERVRYDINPSVVGQSQQQVAPQGGTYGTQSATPIGYGAGTLQSPNDAPYRGGWSNIPGAGIVLDGTPIPPPIRTIRYY